MANFGQLSDLLLNGLKYYNTQKEWEQEVGDFLAPRRANFPRTFYNNLSNDLRHQYASAALTRETNPNVAKGLGDLNEFFNFNQSGTEDTERDQRANSIGRNYALQNPNMTNPQLLEGLYYKYLQDNGR